MKFGIITKWSLKFHKLASLVPEGVNLEILKFGPHIINTWQITPLGIFWKLTILTPHGSANYKNGPWDF